MTEEERQRRIALFQQQPLLWVLLLYATTFFGCAVAIDLLRLGGASPPSQFARYALPLVVVLPAWLAMRSGARRVADAGQRSASE